MFIIRRTDYLFTNYGLQSLGKITPTKNIDGCDLSLSAVFHPSNHTQQHLPSFFPLHLDRPPEAFIAHQQKEHSETDGQNAYWQCLTSALKHAAMSGSSGIHTHTVSVGSFWRNLRHSMSVRLRTYEECDPAEECPGLSFFA